MSAPSASQVDAGDVTKHVKGSIVRCKLINFVTYDNVEFMPGPRLNVVVGPNGSGKSTLVSAFALGLAGSSSILGKGKKPVEFIKHQSSHAIIEIELKDYPKNCVIRRQINRDGSSEWRLNNKKVNEKSVKEATNKFNVQVDNLCQFLPQDRVASFSSLSPEQMLLETEQAVGSESMLNLHKELIELKKKEKDNDRFARSKHEDLVKKQGILEKLEVLWNRQKERVELRKDVQTIMGKQSWTRFEECRLEALAQKAKKEASEANLKEEEKKLEPFRKEIRQAAANVEKERKKISEVRSKFNKAEQMADKASRGFEESEDNYTQIQGEITTRENDKKKRKNQINVLTKQIDELSKSVHNSSRETEIENLRKAAEIAYNEKKTAAADIEKAQDLLAKAREQTQSASFLLRQQQKKFELLQNARTQREKNLRQYDGDVYNAWRWIKDNKSKFRGQVGIVALEIGARDSIYNKYLECALEAWLMKAIVVTSDSDREMLLSEVKDRQKLRINVLQCPRKPNRSRRVNLSAAKLKQIQVDGWLDEFVEAPEFIIDILIANANIQNIAVCDDKVDPKLVEQEGIGLFFTPSRQFRARRSQYGNRAIVSSSLDISRREVRLLKTMGNSEEIKKKINECKQEVDMCRARQTEIENDNKKINSFNEKAKTANRHYNEAVNRLKTEKHKLEKWKRTLEDLQDVGSQEKEVEKLKKKLKVALRERKAHADKLVVAYHASYRALCDYENVQLSSNDNSKRLAELKRMENETTALLEDLKIAVEESSAQFNKCKKEARKLKTEAQDTCPLTEEVKLEFSKLPETSQELTQLLSNKRARLDLLGTLQPGLEEKYHAVKEEVENLESQVSLGSTELLKQRKKIYELRQKWEPELREMIESISKKFGSFMEDIGCAGEVILVVDPSDKDGATDGGKENDDEGGKSLFSSFKNEANGQEKEEEKETEKEKEKELTEEQQLIETYKQASNADFEKARLEIRVQFRESTELRVLDAAVQSGGERSVSTMLFLIALQDITQCPFRLVDEINQGMDPRNERMIFSQVVAAATRAGLPQYFLITPKLLPDLEYNELTSVLIVFNGPYQIPDRQWHMEDCLDSSLKKRKV